MVWPNVSVSEDLNLPAVRVFTDFMLHQPLVVHPRAKAAETEQAMRREHVSFKLVVDDDEHFLGIVTLDELNGEEIMKRVADGVSRQDLVVEDFMKSKSALRSLEYDELEKASLGDVVYSLRAEGQQHCLVIDRDRQCVRGVISAREVARRVRMPLALQYQSSFLDIFKAIHHPLGH